MAVRYTESPSSLLPGEVLGEPVTLPAPLLCTQGERFCGWVRTANTPGQFAEYATERRRHEMGCQGGLIVASR